MHHEGKEQAGRSPTEHLHKLAENTPSRRKPTQLTQPTQPTQWKVDMGSAERKAVDVLISCLVQFAQDNQLNFTKLVLGAKYVD